MWRQAAALQQLAGRGAPRGTGEGREGGARGDGGRSRGEVGAARTPPCGRVTGRTEGACSEGTRARARTLRAPGLSGCVRRAQRLAGWLAGGREGGKMGGNAQRRASPPCLPPLQRVYVPWGGLGECTRVGRPGLVLLVWFLPAAQAPSVNP